MVGGEGLGAGFDTNAADAVAGHFKDREASSTVFEGVSAAWDAAKSGEEESGEGFDAAFAGKAPVHLRFEVADVHAAVKDEAAGGGGEDFGGDVKLVFDFADELLDSVFDCDEADGGSELVDHDCDVAAARLEFVEEIEDGLGFRNYEDLTHDLLESHFRQRRGAEARAGRGAEVHEAGDVLGINDADDEFGAAGGVVDGDAGVQLVDDAGACVLNEHVEGQGEDALTRRHDFAGRELVDFDGAVNEGLLIFRKHAGAARGCGHEL